MIFYLNPEFEMYLYKVMNLNTNERTERFWIHLYIFNISNTVPLIFLKVWPGNLSDNLKWHSRILPNIPTVCIKYSQESFKMSNTRFCDDFNYGFASLYKTLQNFLWTHLILSTHRQEGTNHIGIVFDCMLNNLV